MLGDQARRDQTGVGEETASKDSTAEGWVGQDSSLKPRVVQAMVTCFGVLTRVVETLAIVVVTEVVELIPLKLDEQRLKELMACAAVRGRYVALAIETIGTMSTESLPTRGRLAKQSKVSC